MQELPLSAARVLRISKGEGGWCRKSLPGPPAYPLLFSRKTVSPSVYHRTFGNALVTEGEETALVATTNLLSIRRGFVHPRGKAHGERRRSRRKALAVAAKTPPKRSPLLNALRTSTFSP